MIHNIKFRLFIYQNENQEDLIEALNNVFPDVEYDVEIAEGVLEEPIQILTGRIDKKRKCREFLETLMGIDNEQLIKLKNDLNRKTDEHGNLFLRLDKNDAFDEKWTILDNGDSIHLKIKIAAYPAKKEIAVKKMDDYITNYIN